MRSFYFPRKIVFLFVWMALSLIPMASAEDLSPDSAPVKKPQRIVSMTLGSDEILLSLVDPKRIVGVTYLAVDPKISHVAEAAKAVPYKIRLDLERVVALEPDLVLVASYTSPDFVKQLIDARLPVMKLELFTSIPRIKQNILAVGRAVGEEERARKVIEEMDRRIMEVKKKAASSKKRPGVLAYGPTGSTAGRETTFDEMVTLAGGRNLAADTGIVGHVNISVERLVMIDPEIIILSTWNPEAPGFEQIFLNDPALKQLSALRAKQVHAIPEKYLTTVSQYIVEGVEKMARLIHPELFVSERRNFFALGPILSEGPLSPESGAAARR